MESRLSQDSYECLVHTNFRKKVNKLVKERAVADIVKGYIELYDINFVGHKNPYILTTERNRKSIRAVNLIKEKQCSKIKVQKCADNISQGGTYPCKTLHH